MTQPEHDQPTLSLPTDDELSLEFVAGDSDNDEWAANTTPDSVPNGDDAPEKSKAPVAPNADEVRLQELNLAIELHPNSAVNYLLRGEWFLAKNQLYIAKDDFQKAAQLAETQLETSAWGFTEQWVRDRALAYLQDL